jgi:hypothetical protein
MNKKVKNNLNKIVVMDLKKITNNKIKNEI